MTMQRSRSFKLRTYEVWEKGEKLEITNLYRFLVYDDRATDGKHGSYITPGAIWYTNDRCTFGYIDYDVATSKLVYLKDFWRPDLPGIQKEGDLHRRLHDTKVPHILAWCLAGDVPLSPDHASTFPLAVQRTMTRDYLKGSGRGAGWCPGQPCVEPYVRYRLVSETLGQPLNKSTRQLCEVIRDVDCQSITTEYVRELSQTQKMSILALVDAGKRRWCGPMFIS